MSSLSFIASRLISLVSTFLSLDAITSVSIIFSAFLSLCHSFLVTEWPIVMGMGEKSVSGEPPSWFYISSHPALRDEWRKLIWLGEWHKRNDIRTCDWLREARTGGMMRRKWQFGIGRLLCYCGHERRTKLCLFEMLRERKWKMKGSDISTLWTTMWQPSDNSQGGQEFSISSWVEEDGIFVLSEVEKGEGVSWSISSVTYL